jgi:hypothetical protein
MAYDDPDYQIRRENFAGEAGGTATTEYCKFRSFQAMRLKEVHACVTVAGTTTGHALAVYHGTNSIGSIALGTSAAGAIAHSAVLNELCPSMDQVSVKSLADAAGKAHVVFEYEVTPDAVQS